MTVARIPRRTLLRNAGAILALPMLEAMMPRRLLGGEPSTARAPVPRFLGCYVGNGVVNERWYPTRIGPDYELSPTLAPLSAVRKEVSVISGMGHQRVVGGHGCEPGWLTSCRKQGPFTLSVDQLIAARIGGETRYPSLQLGPSNRSLLSYNAQGIALPGMSSSQIYRQLFVEDPAASRVAARARLSRSRSVLDLVGEQAKRLSGELGAADRRKLDEYLGSVREVERQLEHSTAFVDAPKPIPDAKMLANDLSGTLRDVRACFDLAFLAFLTDSARAISFLVCGETSSYRFPEIGCAKTHHDLSHHGGDPETLRQLALIDHAYVSELARFLGRLAAAEEQGRPLLASTIVLYGSGLNNGIGFANGSGQHGNSRVPVLLCGGSALGIRQGRHLRFAESPPPLANLLLTAARACGVADERFGDSTGTLTELL